MGMYNQFETDSKMEREGIVIDYGDFRVTLARAGGGNRKFARVLEAKTKPYRRALETETMDDQLGDELMHEVYAEAVVKNWEVRHAPTEEGGESHWEQGIEGPDGDVLPVTAENIAATFKNLPDLFSDLREQAGKVALFRKSIQEVEAGN